MTELRDLSVPGDVLCFARFLYEAERLPDDEWLYFLQKPWKWEPEYVLWFNNGQPQTADEADFATLVALLDA